MKLALRTGALIAALTCGVAVVAQKNTSKAYPISADLFGIFFEDLSFAADGGLYAEMVQNRSFEYSPVDREGWQSFSYWQYCHKGYGYGTLSVESSRPIHPNNPHYLSLGIEDPGQEGIGISNQGFDGMQLHKGQQYNFSIFLRQVSAQTVNLHVFLLSNKGDTLGNATIATDDTRWKKYERSFVVAGDADSATLFILATSRGKLDMDMVSLFPANTFHLRANGLRNDLATAIANIHPHFMRFPGGCLVHGDGVANIYRWKNSIGPVEERLGQRNIWNYHQSDGLGFFEYFQFCEDIGAKPLPVVAAGVSCQNSGGTWAIGSTGQKAIPMEEMNAYVQDILDLIEYANGPVNSTWGAKRAAAGHPAPFNLQYVGVGNEDKQTDAFRERFAMIYDAVHAKHPEITIVGTAGPFHSGEDFDLGWNFSRKLQVPLVDEHYYEKPEWFRHNAARYDNYDRHGPKVYVGEYASWGNTLMNALSEAAYMCSLERNGDVVHMASYAPLLANQAHTSWNPNLIYFNNTGLLKTCNYYVQQLFSANAGNSYMPGIVGFVNRPNKTDTVLAASCVKDDRSGDLIIKLVNTGAESATASILLPKHYKTAQPVYTRLSGAPAAKNTWDKPDLIVPIVEKISMLASSSLPVPPYSLIVLRIPMANH